MKRMRIPLNDELDVLVIASEGEIILESRNATAVVKTSICKKIDEAKRIIGDLFPEIKKRDERRRLAGVLQRQLREIIPILMKEGKEKERKEKFDHEVEEEAERILNSPDPIREINKHLGRIIAGEWNNRIAIFLLLLSGKIQDPEAKQMILLKGTEGAGKSTLMNIADLFKTKSVGRFTEHALDYSDLEGYEVLKLKEIGAMDLEKQGVSTIKFLSSDDKGYTVEVTIQDKATGRFKTEQRVIPPITLITSTTRVILDPQFERRAWIFNPDETEAQTARVKKLKIQYLKEKYQVELGLRKYTSKDFSFKVLKCLLSKLEPCRVIIPFLNTLSELLSDKILRTRGDYDKIVTFIEVFHIPYQRQLPSIKEDEKIILAVPELAFKALNIIREPLTSMIVSLERRSRELFKHLENLKIIEKGDKITKEHRDDIARLMKRSEKTIRSYLSEWEKSGYLSSEGGGRGKPKVFTLLYDLKEIQEKELEILAVFQSAGILVEKMKKEGAKFITRYWKYPPRVVDKYFYRYFESPFINFIPSIQMGFSNLKLRQKQAEKSKKSEENRQIKKLPEYREKPLKRLFNTHLHLVEERYVDEDFGELRPGDIVSSPKLREKTDERLKCKNCLHYDAAAFVCRRRSMLMSGNSEPCEFFELRVGD